MFDISVLKEMKLSELQDIAKLAKTIKFAGVKKEALIQLIIEQQAKSESEDQTTSTPDDKPKRARIAPEKKTTPHKKETVTLFSEPETVKEETATPEIIVDKPEATDATVPEKKEKTVKFKKELTTETTAEPTT